MHYEKGLEILRRASPPVCLIPIITLHHCADDEISMAFLRFMHTASNQKLEPGKAWERGYDKPPFCDWS